MADSRAEAFQVIMATSFFICAALALILGYTKVEAYHHKAGTLVYLYLGFLSFIHLFIHSSPPSTQHFTPQSLLAI